MKFSCDRCATRYSIGDDKVRGKILKIRCKTCGNIVVVREATGAVQATAGAVASRRTAAGSSAAEASENAEAAMASLALDNGAHASLQTTEFR